MIIGDGAIATVPDRDQQQLLHRVLGGVPVEDLLDVDRLRTVVAVAEVRGPAKLSYLDERDFRPAAGTVAGTVAAMPADHPDVVALLAAVPPDEVGESGVDDISSPAFVVRESDQGPIVALCGYQAWLDRVAHVSVLTGGAARGRGLGRLAASAAVADALAHGLLPQWRARIAPSLRIARALGFTELGAQLSLRIDA